MDYVIDRNDKNWPTLDKPRFQNDQIVVSMGEHGFKAVTNGAPGVGSVVLAGNNYKIQLPGTVADAGRMEVRFAVAPDRKPNETK